MTNATECCFCEELLRGSSVELAARYGDHLRNRAAWVSREFAVLPTIGQLSLGHMLLVSRTHANSLAAVARSGVPAGAAYTSVLKKLESRFGACMAFEHGTPVGDVTGGCGIVHAHLHVVPTGELRAARLPVVPGARWREVDAHEWLDGAAGTEYREGYLFVRLPAGRAFAAVARNVPSQFLRRWAARSLRTRTWDWRAVGAERELPQLVSWMRLTAPPAGFVTSEQR
jgi:diadenosine tetraphosphate (Ap4A) HIT family hydrolase